jgi:hypothetical protein
MSGRFWEKVAKSDEGCWEWLGAISCGYGNFYWGGRAHKAHRVSWEIHNGPIPDGVCVLHHCDNPRCVHPDHLYIGDKQDNARDREKRNRSNHATGERHGRYTHPGQTRGSKNGRSKLTEQQVRELLNSHYKQGTCKAELARRYGVSDTTVCNIVSGKLWPHVEGRV